MTCTSGGKVRPVHGMVVSLLHMSRPTHLVLPGMCLGEAEVEGGKGAEIRVLKAWKSEMR